LNFFDWPFVNLFCGVCGSNGDGTTTVNGKSQGSTLTAGFSSRVKTRNFWTKQRRKAMTKGDIIPRFQVRGEGDMVHVRRDRPEVVFCFNACEARHRADARRCSVWHDPMTFSSPSGDF
jgi:hypothetical protein